MARLTPNAYPDDDDASAAFASATRADLLDRRLHDARTVRASLQMFDPDAEVTDADARIPAMSWCAVTTWTPGCAPHRHPPRDRDAPRHHRRRARRRGDGQAVYDWLGYRLELLIEAVDESDADALR